MDNVSLTLYRTQHCIRRCAQSRVSQSAVRTSRPRKDLPVLQTPPRKIRLHPRPGKEDILEFV